MRIEIVKADYSNITHQQAIPELLNKYSLDEMGGGQPLSQFTCDNLVNELKKRDYAFSVLAFVENQPAGLINCFEAFSTFKCRPLINIHDVCVNSEFRGLGLSQRMLEKVEEIAIDRGCCKLTLEVLSCNDVAKSAYRKFGFGAYELDPAAGQAMFWQKNL